MAVVSQGICLLEKQTALDRHLVALEAAAYLIQDVGSSRGMGHAWKALKAVAGEG